MAESSFEQVIAERGELIYTNVGDSMYPLIKPRDLLVIQKPVLPLKRMDIPLYRRANGQYVLHRAVKVRGGSYVMCGDNRFALEKGITDSQIIGMLTAVIRRGRTISVDAPSRRLYAHLWCDFLPIRRAVLYLKRVIGRQLQKLCNR